MNSTSSFEILSEIPSFQGSCFVTYFTGVIALRPRPEYVKFLGIAEQPLLPVTREHHRMKLPLMSAQLMEGVVHILDKFLDRI